MNRKGFTLIELMIVIAIIAIIAAIAIPGILAATRAANERNASGSAKQFGSVEVTFKTSDSDQNSINDYWTADVAGLYYIQPTGASVPIKMIELAVCFADGNTDITVFNNTYATPNPAHLSSPKAGYWFMAQTDYETTAAGAVTAYTRRNTDRFSFIACPNAYGSSGKLVFIISEGGTMYKKDGGSDVLVWTTLPATGVADTGGVLTDPYNTFPLDPNAAAIATCAGPWSKMD